LISEKAEGAQIRARAEWIENGEKSTKYFLFLEREGYGKDVQYMPFSSF